MKFTDTPEVSLKTRLAIRIDGSTIRSGRNGPDQSGIIELDEPNNLISEAFSTQERYLACKNHRSARDSKKNASMAHLKQTDKTQLAAL